MTDRIKLIHDWLQGQLQLNTYHLEPASEDASFRRYYRLTFDNKTRILMDAPPEQESCEQFIKIAGILLRAGVNVPEILESNTDLGLVLISDFGHTSYLQALSEMNANYFYVDAMQALHSIQENTTCAEIPEFSQDLLFTEMNLFRDWLLHKHLDLSLDNSESESLDKIFKMLAMNALEQPQVFVHRDYHSRNLMVTRDNNPGILDFQDAVCGPYTYDLVSLLKDCYIKWPQEKITGWALAFHGESDIEMGEAEFLQAFDLMGVQRHLKASGIFARLYHRDGKSGYLQDIPRTLSYILDLGSQYPDLHSLITLINNRVMPELKNLHFADGS